jgi:hypothetical protein
MNEFERQLEVPIIRERMERGCANDQARTAEQGQSKDWECFHCGEHFTSVGAAQDHFGTTPEDQAACKIKVGEERGLVMSLRRAHKDREELWQIIDDIDTLSDAAKSDDAGYRRSVERMVQKRNAIAESPDGHKLNWKRDLLWDESAKVIDKQPTQTPAGDVVERMMVAISMYGSLANMPELHRQEAERLVAVAREGYVSQQERDAQWEQAIYNEVRCIPSFGDTATSSFVAHVRARLTKPAEQTPEQIVEAILLHKFTADLGRAGMVAAEIVGALKAGKQ